MAVQQDPVQVVPGQEAGRGAAPRGGQEVQGTRFRRDWQGALHAHRPGHGPHHRQPHPHLLLHICWGVGLCILGGLGPHSISILLLHHTDHYWVHYLHIIYTLSTHHIPLILISTNRFGDLYPQKAFLGFREDPIALMKMCFTVAYCIFGKQSYEDWIILLILFLFRDDPAVNVHEPDAGADCGESVLDCPRAWHEGRWQR